MEAGCNCVLGTLAMMLAAACVPDSTLRGAKQDAASDVSAGGAGDSSAPGAADADATYVAPLDAPAEDGASSGDGVDIDEADVASIEGASDSTLWHEATKSGRSHTLATAGHGTERTNRTPRKL
jgi:hypothetical protein